MVIANNHISLTSCNEITQIMMPQLRKHGITIFNFYKHYFDGSVIRLSTSEAWTKHYFKKGYINTSTVPASYLSKQLNYFIWMVEDSREMLMDAAINFNFSNGITIAKRYSDSIEFYGFGANTNNRAIVNHFYINHLDLLHQYCLYFRDNAKELFGQAEKNKIITLDTIEKSKNLNQVITNNMLKKIKLSYRQYDCAHLLLQGNTAREIAGKLNLSHRTVEHYIDNLKLKLSCKNKTELIIKLTDLIN